MVPALNIINIYGCIEEKKSNDDILESWTQIKKELNKIKERDEAVIIIGDTNRAVGCDKNGVVGNKSKISYGGGLVRDLIESGDYFMMNSLDLVEGGPWTREDPAFGTMSCLDLAIGSANLRDCVVRMVVDKEKMFTPFRAVTTRGVVGRRHTDHLSLLIELKMRNKKTIQKTETKWNTSKPDGWNNYKWISNMYAEQIKKVCLDENDVDKIEKKLSMIENKIRFAAFGKTKIKYNKPKPKPKPQQTEEEANKEILRKESKKIEEQVEALKKSKLGRVGQVLKLREAVSGPKKKGQEAIALKDSRTGQLVVSTSEIKRVTTEYCQDLFKNNSPTEGFKEQNNIKQMLHEELI